MRQNALLIADMIRSAFSEMAAIARRIERVDYSTVLVLVYISLAFYFEVVCQTKLVCVTLNL